MGWGPARPPRGAGPCRAMPAASLPAHRLLPWEAERGRKEPSAQLFGVTLEARRALKPSLNERVEASGSHGHLRLASHPGGLPGDGAFVATSSSLCGLQCQAVGRLRLAAYSAGCDTVESGGSDLGKGLAMSVGKCESRGFQS